MKSDNVVMIIKQKIILCAVHMYNALILFISIALLSNRIHRTSYIAHPFPFKCDGKHILH